MRLWLLASMALASVSAPAREPTGEPALAKIVADRPAAAPVNCIDPRLVPSTQIIDGTAIVYDMGGRLYVNRPLSGAARLREDDILLTKVTGGELCRIDPVTLLDRTTRGQRGFVVLGSFAVYGPRRR